MSKPPASHRWKNFQARLRALFARRRGEAHADVNAAAAPAAGPAAVTATTPPPAAAPTPQAGASAVAPSSGVARTVEGNARSRDRATAPWLLLRPERRYRLHLPPHASSDDPLPLVIMIHGCRETAEEFEQGTRMSALADREGFAVLYPDQANFANIRRCWNWFEPNTAAGNGECAIILAMIYEAARHAKLSKSRVYVAGISSGGALAALLGYHHPDVFAGVAVHSGLPPMMPASPAAAIAAMEKGVRVDPDALADAYWNTHEVTPPPLIVLHGDADATVTERNAQALVSLWARLYECAPQATSLVRDDRTAPATDTVRGVAQSDYQCAGHTVVRRLSVHGLGHAWSGGDASLPFNDALGPSASEAIWAFFRAQRRPTTS
ncbi:MAG: PHB depolymerase family esterase [Burkholderiales bacterium]|nr:PHB depolymerase family esterase [Burkholderiales bacterium]